MYVPHIVFLTKKEHNKLKFFLAIIIKKSYNFIKVVRIAPKWSKVV